jgi:hypothetical protein
MLISIYFTQKKPLEIKLITRLIGNVGKTRFQLITIFRVKAVLTSLCGSFILTSNPRP